MVTHCTPKDRFIAFIALYDANIRLERLSAEHLHVAGRQP
jgi:hypothetical protein